mmetsp:Transcript_58223/g.52441  ORF Transcript_58223/g.52441 Transcript_58223/m.52441 type:complete len:148 (+) Transcript_58223:161-604(+)
MMNNILSLFTILMTMSYQVYALEKLLFQIQNAFIDENAQPGKEIDGDSYHLKIECESTDWWSTQKKEVKDWKYTMDGISQINKITSFDFPNNNFKECKLTLIEDELWNDEHGEYYIVRQQLAGKKGVAFDAVFSDMYHVSMIVTLSS